MHIPTKWHERCEISATQTTRSLNFLDGVFWSNRVWTTPLWMLLKHQEVFLLAFSLSPPFSVTRNNVLFPFSFVFFHRGPLFFLWLTPLYISTLLCPFMCECWGCFEKKGGFSFLSPHFLFFRGMRSASQVYIWEEKKTTQSLSPLSHDYHIIGNSFTYTLFLLRVN
jgi:hypothetical protein